MASRTKQKYELFVWWLNHIPFALPSCFRSIFLFSFSRYFFQAKSKSFHRRYITVHVYSNSVHGAHDGIFWNMCNVKEQTIRMYVYMYSTCTCIFTYVIREVSMIENGERSASRTKITPNDSPHCTLSISSDPDGKGLSDLFTCISLHLSSRIIVEFSPWRSQKRGPEV